MIFTHDTLFFPPYILFYEFIHIAKNIVVVNYVSQIKILILYPARVCALKWPIFLSVVYFYLPALFTLVKCLKIGSFCFKYGRTFIFYKFCSGAKICFLLFRKMNMWLSHALEIAQMRDGVYDRLGDIFTFHGISKPFEKNIKNLSKLAVWDFFLPVYFHSKTLFLDHVFLK